MNISGNTILITGGTSGLGLAFAEEFLKADNTVIICGRRKERLEEIEAKYPAIITNQTDIADAVQREDLASWIAAEHPQTNILVNNAGVQYHADLTTPINLEKVREEMETNFIAPVHLASLFAPFLSGKENATIINVSSGLAFAPLAFMPVYCASKAAIHSLTLSLRHQLKSKNVKVFEIIPPSVDTELGHHQRQEGQSHGGIPISEFISGAMEALKNDVLEAPIGQSVGLRAKREEMFDIMNH